MGDFSDCYANCVVLLTAQSKLKIFKVMLKAADLD